jgi:hypothetical protein
MRAFGWCGNLTDVILPNSLTTIGSWAFGSCKGIKNLNIPQNVETMGINPFFNCNFDVTISSANSYFKVVGNSIYSGDNKTLVSYLPQGNETSFSIPGTVTKIGGWAFYDRQNLTSISMPNGITEIGTYAFYGCRGLTSFTIPQGITCIGSSVFAYCRNLDSVKIPKNVSSIESWAFSSCDSLKHIYYGGSKTDWKKITIGKYGNEKLSSAFNKATIHYNSR